MKKRNAKRPPFAVVLLLTAAVIGGMTYYSHWRREAMPTVTLMTVERTDVTETVVCTGTVSAVEGVDVYARLPCVAGTIDVAVGDYVKKGDVLITIDREATLGVIADDPLTATVNATMLSSLGQSVVAPADGVVSAVSAAQGEWIDPSSPCVVLSDKTDVEIAVVIRESVLPKVEVGQEVTVSGVAFDKSGYRGVITDIATSARSRVSAASGETVVDAVISLYDGEADDSLMVGLSAKATVTVATYEDVLLVPYTGVIREADGSAAVYCYSDSGTVCRKPVTTAGEFADGVAVADGLSEGEKIVTDPQALTDGSVWYAEGER